METYNKMVAIFEIANFRLLEKINICLTTSAVRDKVSRAVNNDDLDHIFDTDGFFM